LAETPQVQTQAQTQAKSVDEILRAYEALSQGRFIEVVTGASKVDQNRVVGVVVDPRNTGVERGLVVLFAREPQHVGTKVACYDFEKRTSQSGKNYIKCFEWVELSSLGNTIEALRRAIVAAKVEEAVTVLPERYRQAARDILLHGNMSGIQDLVVFYGGEIPLRDHMSTAYIAIVDGSGVYEASVNGVPGEVRYSAPPGVAVIPVDEGQGIPGRVVEVAGRHFLITSGRVAEAVRYINQLNLPPEVRTKVIAKIAVLASATGATAGGAEGTQGGGQ